MIRYNWESKAFRRRLDPEWTGFRLGACSVATRRGIPHVCSGFCGPLPTQVVQLNTNPP